jgi:tryptophanyl-tRNA synthetase
VTKKKRIVSGVQPTGHLHIGNYLGAIANWVKIHKQFEGFFFVVDLHALTNPPDPKHLRENTYKIAAVYLAAGINPDQASIFIQSHVRAHTQLTWLLNCATPLNWLERMIQFKEKAVKQGEEVSVGLLDYPVLMAADILLYQPDLVPVGEDQRQHLELTRDIAQRFNRQFGSKDKPVFKIPEAYIPPSGARVMSLTDGTKKMSKSDESDASRINLLDPPDVIEKKIKRCKTDTEVGLTFDPSRPEAYNLLTLYQVLTGKTKEEAENECREMSYGKFKPLLTEATIAVLKPLQDRYHELMNDQGHLESILKRGTEKAEAVAEETLAHAEEAMGLVRPFR